MFAQGVQQGQAEQAREAYKERSQVDAADTTPFDHADLKQYHLTNPELPAQTDPDVIALDGPPEDSLTALRVLEAAEYGYAQLFPNTVMFAVSIQTALK